MADRRTTRLTLCCLLAAGCTATDPDVDGPADPTGDASAASGSSANGDTSGLDANNDASTGAPFTGPVAVDCIDDVSAGHHVYECGGITWDVEVPSRCHDAPCGLILDVHGFSMTGPIEDANTDLQAQGRAHGFVVLQPTAPGAVPDWSAQDHDEAVYEALLLAIEAFAVDPRRVHMTGFSQGGSMTWRFTCAHPELFASVAPGGAATGCSSSGSAGCLLDDRLADTPIDILYLLGTNDALVDFACFEPQVESVRAAFDLGPAQSLAEEDGYRRTRYASDAGTVLETLVHDYVAESSIIDGHCFPGSDDLDGDLPGQLFPFACQPPNAFDWGDEVVAFFLAHPG